MFMQILFAARLALQQQQGSIPAAVLREEMRIVSNESSIGTSLTAVSPGSLVHPDGRIFTLHMREAVVRVFDANGRFLQTFGRAGDGPGEFRMPFVMGMVGDSIWVFDAGRRHYDIFGPDLAYKARFLMPRGANIPQFGLTAERSTLVQYGGDDTARIVIHNADSSRVRQVQFRPKQKEHRFQVQDPGIPMTVTDNGVSRSIMSLAGPRMIESPLQARDVVIMSLDGKDVFAVEPGETWGGSPGQFRVSRVSMSTGQLAPPSVFALPARRITPGERDSIVDAAARATARIESQIRTGARLPEYYPPFLSVGALGSGLLLLREYLRPQERLIVDVASGTFTRVQLPEGLVPFAVTRTHVWGTLRDANDLPIVVRYRVVRPQ
jgi:hypothetical protein